MQLVGLGEAIYFHVVFTLTFIFKLRSHEKDVIYFHMITSIVFI